MRKDCGDAAETVRKDYGSSADIVRNMGGPGGPAADATSKCTLGPPYLGHHSDHSDPIFRRLFPAGHETRAIPSLVPTLRPGVWVRDYRITDLGPPPLTSRFNRASEGILRTVDQLCVTIQRSVTFKKSGRPLHATPNPPVVLSSLKFNLNFSEDSTTDYGPGL